MHQMRISTTQVSSVMLRSKKLEIREKMWQLKEQSDENLKWLTTVNNVMRSPLSKMAAITVKWRILSDDTTLPQYFSIIN
jgi:hypothetical protein